MKNKIKIALLRISKLTLFLFLFPVALSILLLLTIWAFFVSAYSIIVNKEKRNIGEIIDRLTTYFNAIDISIDQLGNVSCKTPLNEYFTADGGHLHGDTDETISEVLGINKLIGKQKRKWLQILLDKIEKDHTVDAFISSYEKAQRKVNKYRTVYQKLKEENENNN